MSNDNAKLLATIFHQTYERLAPQHGYTTREDTRELDFTTPNGALMASVCQELLDRKVIMMAPVDENQEVLLTAHPDGRRSRTSYPDTLRGWEHIGLYEELIESTPEWVRHRIQRIPFTRKLRYTLHPNSPFPRYRTLLLGTWLVRVVDPSGETQRVFTLTQEEVEKWYAISPLQ